MRSIFVIGALLTHEFANAGFGGMSSVEGSDVSSSAGPVSPSALISVVAGAIAGFFIERAINAADLKKQGVKDTTGFMLGGKIGALVGAIIGPILLGLFR